ncbi:hypothetical protein Godav_002454 [Gossypium davidsonii]|uniref:Uncharacterized protein n=1 Tax=Gossypium davidsonii TaxID=34287 RepID=A0A7J8SX04_GOSDV|nr:hypothetical protein [Gossypium davidsonii]
MARQVIVVALIFMAVVGAFVADAAPSPAPSQAPSSSPSGAPASGPISASPSEGPSAEGSEAEGPDTEGPDAEGPDADGPDVEGPEGQYLEQEQENRLVERANVQSNLKMIKGDYRVNHASYVDACYNTLCPVRLPELSYRRLPCKTHITYTYFKHTW